MRATKKVGVFDSKETVAAKIPLNEMVIDDYQGHVNKLLVAKMVKNWDEAASGAIILNLRDDNTYAVLDGQHRVLAARQIGVAELNALVFIGKTKEEEARLFVQLNTKHNVSSIDRFRANLVAGNLREKNIRAAVREVGLDIAMHTKITPDSMSCAAALVSIYESFGLPHLKTTLGVLTSAFNPYPDRRKGYSQVAVLGTAQFLFRYPEVDIKRLIEQMKTKSPTVLIAMGDTKIDAHSDLWTGWAKMLVSLYNDKLGVRNALRLDPVKMEGKKYSPAALVKLRAPERQKARMASLSKAREASRQRMIAINERRKQEKELASRVVTTVGSGKPLTSSMVQAAAKTRKK